MDTLKKECEVHAMLADTDGSISQSPIAMDIWFRQKERGMYMGTFEEVEVEIIVCKTSIERRRI